jgi:hypothetical protein
MSSGSSQSKESGSFKALKGASFFRPLRSFRLDLIWAFALVADHLVFEGLVWVHGLPSSALVSSESLRSPEVRSLHSSVVQMEALKSLAESRHFRCRSPCPPWSLSVGSVSLSDNVSSLSEEVSTSSRRRL